MFVGDNADKFLPLYHERYSSASGGKRKSSFQFNFMAAFLPLVWFFYRKMYLHGAITILVPVVIYTLFPGLPAVSTGLYAVLFGVVSNHLYVIHAVRAIRKIEKLDIPADEKDLRIMEAGDTSLLAAGLGGLIIVVLTASAIIAVKTAKLPACDDASVTSLTYDLLAEGAKKSGNGDMSIRLMNFSEEEETKEGRRICSFDFHIGPEKNRTYLALSWQNKREGMFQIDVKMDKKDLVNVRK
ncbi:MAG: DUF2628 domain-containing protein [Sneathiella sp.]